MAEKLYAAAVDQGTTGTRFMVFSKRGEVVAASYAEHEQIYPQPGWVEHDPLQIWDRTESVIRRAMREGHIAAEQISGIGITNQRETTVVWDPATGTPYHNAIVWQCTRTRDTCQKLIDDGLEKTFKAKTGLPIATYFSGPKIRWLLDNVDGLRGKAEAGRALFGNVDKWLIWWLTGGPDGGAHVTDYTNASRTMLMDLHTLEWDAELLSILGIPRRMLPTIRPSSGDIVNYQWTIVEAPATMPGDAGKIIREVDPNCSFTLDANMGVDEVGQWVIELAVTDSEGQTDTDTVTVTVEQ